ncbi:hypothetical protein SAMN02745202_01899 [Segatella oulorum]|uniref:Uncharacterized protein n=1 Tax=Segatella oulorum TaxID=28136 RepID=A0A1T4QR75_9BACT|nr:hypothetical protein SAMN02745202_01899 [Segatella oulorum]
MNYSCIDFKINVGNLGNDKIVLVIPNGVGVCAPPCMLLIVLLILNKADVYATKVHASRCRFATKLAVFS